MKKSYLNELKAIQEMAYKIHSLNEAMLFNEEEFDNMPQEEDYMDPEAEQMPTGEEMPTENPQGQEANTKMGDMEPQQAVGSEDDGMAELDQMGEIDKIREITLQGMMKLCKTPEDAKYQALRKIFQMCDKSVDEKAKEQQGNV